MNHRDSRMLSLHSAETMPAMPAIWLRTPPERGASQIAAVALPKPKISPPLSLYAASLTLALTAMAVVTGLVGAISGDGDWMMYGFLSAVLLAVLTLVLSLFVVDDLGS